MVTVTVMVLSAGRVFRNRPVLGHASCSAALEAPVGAHLLLAVPGSAEALESGGVAEAQRRAVGLEAEGALEVARLLLRVLLLGGDTAEKLVGVAEVGQGPFEGGGGFVPAAQAHQEEAFRVNGAPPGRGRAAGLGNGPWQRGQRPLPGASFGRVLASDVEAC